MTRRVTSERLVRLACVSALAGIGLMAWSLFDPRPLQVVGAMSVGQVFGTFSLAVFLYVVARDLRPGLGEALLKRDRDDAEGSDPPIGPVA